MANISQLIKQAVSASAGNVSIPTNLKDQILGGLSDSVFGSLAQTATKVGGIEQVKSLLTGKTSASSSPITALAGNLFKSNVLGKLNLNSTLTSGLSALVPVVMGKLSGVLKDQDGDGDVDIQDVLIALKGGSATKGGSVLGAAAGILGNMFKK